MGSIDRRSNAPGQVIVPASEWILHENYDSATFNNDIALLRVPSIALADNIQVIALAEGTHHFANEMATLSGWGRIADAGSPVNILNFVDTPVWENSLCADIYGSAVIINSTLCTDGASCNGDSGGPLILNNVQIGVVSFGASESCTDFPSGYVRVTSFGDWISEKTGGVV